MKLHKASERGDEATAQLLIDKGVNVDTKQDCAHIVRIQINISIIFAVQKDDQFPNSSFRQSRTP
jgi:hypothetical protein